MIIYKTTNLLNGKIYIGQDKNNDPNYYGSGLLLKKAIKKYGKNNFIKEVLEYCDTKEILDEREIYHIKKYDAINRGYNLSIGGTGGPNFLNKSHREETKEKMKNMWDKRKEDPNFKHNMVGFKHSEETKEKMSLSKNGKFCGPKNSMYGKKHTEESRQKMGRPRFGSENPMYGKKHTEEAKQKISEKTKGENNPMYGKKHTEESKQKIRDSKDTPVNSKKVNINGVIYSSIMEASRVLDISTYLIKVRCKNDKHKWCFI
jgi:group I intron endonuclease